jgi:signal transduction histidine kinase
MEEPAANSQGNVPDPARLEKLGLLVAGIAHNLYGPLTGIIGTLDLLKLKQPNLSGDLERVSGLARRLQDEIRVMLYKAEIEYKGKVAMVDFVDLINREIEFYKGDPRLKHMVEITFEPPDDLPTFRGTLGDFSQSLSNLITNAVEAMEESETKELTIRLEEKDENIVLAIQDTGTGMDEETASKAFDPFFTTKQPQAGGKFPDTLAIGLGLTHVKNMLEPEGVRIDVNSTPGDGTEIILTIPYKEIDQRHGEI